MSRVISFSFVFTIAVLFVAGSSVAIQLNFDRRGDQVDVPCKRKNLTCKLPPGDVLTDCFLDNNKQETSDIIKENGLGGLRVGIAAICGWSGAVGQTGERHLPGGLACHERAIECAGGATPSNRCFATDLSGTDLDGLRSPLLGLAPVTVRREACPGMPGLVRYRISNPNAVQVDELINPNCGCCD